MSYRDYTDQRPDLQKKIYLNRQSSFIHSASQIDNRQSEIGNFLRLACPELVEGVSLVYSMKI